LGSGRKVALGGLEDGVDESGRYVYKGACLQCREIIFGSEDLETDWVPPGVLTFPLSFTASPADGTRPSAGSPAKHTRTGTGARTTMTRHRRRMTRRTKTTGAEVGAGGNSRASGFPAGASRLLPRPRRGRRTRGDPAAGREGDCPPSARAWRASRAVSGEVAAKAPRPSPPPGAASPPLSLQWPPPRGPAADSRRPRTL
jgi:hypothetical protein